MHITKVISAIAVLAFASSTALAQSDCTMCVSKEILKIKECSDLALGSVVTLDPSDTNNRACYCKVGKSLTIFDACTNECPPGALQSYKTTYTLGAEPLCKGVSTTDSGCATVSASKAGAALVAIAAALQVVL
ncbi:hypothetical protein BGW41_000914 [Actinomortierella wolfii]|nr:hypothetical protein BGW41_000914 [Actinomortierella wolfii]